MAPGASADSRKEGNSFLYTLLYQYAAVAWPVFTLICMEKRILYDQDGRSVQKAKRAEMYDERSIRGGILKARAADGMEEAGAESFERACSLHASIAGMKCVQKHTCLLPHVFESCEASQY